jgi:DNA-binding NarL/FixJ family response regulator
MRAGHAGCRLVALTVHSSDAARQMARAAGFDAFVVKGAPLQELLGAISSRRNPQPDQEPATALSHTASSETGGVS